MSTVLNMVFESLEWALVLRNVVLTVGLDSHAYSTMGTRATKHGRGRARGIDQKRQGKTEMMGKGSERESEKNNSRCGMRVVRDRTNRIR